jgi:hypothetical protein
LYVEVLLAVSDFVRGLVVAAISYFLAALYLMRRCNGHYRDTVIHYRQQS